MQHLAAMMLQMVANLQIIIVGVVEDVQLLQKFLKLHNQILNQILIHLKILNLKIIAHVEVEVARNKNISMNLNAFAGKAGLIRYPKVNVVNVRLM